MAISPPSDIVLDVANAVSRTDVETARAELKARIAGRGAAPATEFSAATTKTSAPRAVDAKAKNPFVKFEAMVLQSFVKSMLPEDAQSVYGEGLSGDMWKSMLAEKISETIAERGGIGIADRMLPDHYMQGERAVPIAGVARGAAHAEADEKSSLAGALVDTLQRSMLVTLRDDADRKRNGVTATGDSAGS